MSAAEETKLHLSDAEDDAHFDENENSRRKDAYKSKRHHNTNGEYDEPLLEPGKHTQEVAQDDNSNGDYELSTRQPPDRQTQAVLEQMLKTLQQLVPPKKGWHLKLLKTPKETTDTIATIARNKAKVSHEYSKTAFVAPALT